MSHYSTSLCLSVCLSLSYTYTHLRLIRLQFSQFLKSHVLSHTTMEFPLFLNSRLITHLRIPIAVLVYTYCSGITTIGASYSQKCSNLVEF